MSDHTPGPWVLHKRDDEDEATMVKHVGENNDMFVCVTNVNWRYPKENAANARLIAATPDLLEALKDMIAEFSADEFGGEAQINTCWKAKQVVAKAEGKS